MDISTPKASATEGRIICVHPDGHRTIFAEKLYAVFGMQYLDGKLYVMHNPKFSVFVDDNGVGKDRIDLIEQTNPQPWALEWNDHVPANFKLAMDGYFYIAVGDKGLFNCVGRDGKRIDMRGGGIVRMRPDGTGLEIYCTGVRNILDVAINDEDELFTYDNTDEHDWMGRFTHMVDGGFYGYPYDFVPRRPYTLWMMADFGGGAATAAFCYTEDALPQEYRGNMFLADFGKRQIMRVIVKRAGATYEVVAKSDFFSEVPADFRPVGICLAPDGKSIYVCDWQHADTKENVTVGRLHRLTYAGKTFEAAKPGWYLAAAMGKAFDASTKDLLAALSHPSREMRMVAQRRLAERGAEAIEGLTLLVKNDHAPALARSHAIWGLDAIDQGKSAREAIVAAMDSPDVVLRRQAIRQLGNRTTALFARMRWAHNHDDASVRFAAATALGRMGDAANVGVLPSLLRDRDPVVRFAAFTAMNRIGRQKPQAWDYIVDRLRSENDGEREGIVFALRETYDVKLVSELAKLAFDKQKPTKARSLAMQLLADVCYTYPQWKGEWWAYHPALNPRPQKTAEWSETKSIMGLLRELLNDPQPEIQRAAIEGIAKTKDVENAPQLRKLLVSQPDAATKAALLRALGQIKDKEANPLIAAVLQENDLPVEVLSAAIEAAGEIASAELVAPLAGHLLNPDAQIAVAVLNALSRIPGEPATQAFARSLEDTRLEVRQTAVRLLANRHARSAVPDLLKLIDDPQLGAAALMALAKTPDARALKAYVKALQSKDATLREQTRAAIAKIADQILPQLELQSNQLPQQVIAELQKALAKHEKARKGPIFAIAVRVLEPGEYEAFAAKNGGEAARGQKLFEDADGLGCIRCHSVAGKGGSIGPDLSTIAAQFSRELLIESVLYPSKAIREGYQVFTVKTRRGEIEDGLFKGETDAAVMLLDSAGTLHTIPKSQIISRRASAISLMPEGLQSALSLEEFADLIAYLQSLRPGAAARDRANEKFRN